MQPIMSTGKRMKPAPFGTSVATFSVPTAGARVRNTADTDCCLRVGFPRSVQLLCVFPVAERVPLDSGLSTAASARVLSPSHNDEAYATAKGADAVPPASEL